MIRVSALLLRLSASSALAACQGVGSASPVGTLPPARGVLEPPTASARAARELEPACVTFLAQVQCWLRAAGNGPGAVEEAVGNARASFEARPEASSICEHAMSFRRVAIDSAGCGGVTGQLRELPPSATVECAPDVHFFVREDGHISGCRPDCTSSSDCPEGTFCGSKGSAAGGPIDEQYCE